MLTRMTDEDWEIGVEVFRAVRSRRGDKGRDDRTFLEALHYFAVHNITWRALPVAFGNWNSVWMVDSQTTNSALSAAATSGSIAVGSGIVARRSSCPEVSH